MRLSPRVLAVGFGQNFATFLAWGVLPVWATYEMHADAGAVGSLPAVSGVAYILVALGAGRLSNRFGRARLARVGMAGFALFALLAWHFRTVEAVRLLGALNGASLALVWPALQAKVGDASGAEDLEHNLGVFSLSWSLAKTLGFMVVGVVFARFGIHTLLLCCVVAVAMIPILPGDGRASRHDAPAIADDHDPAHRAAHLRSGWWANFAAYGTGATLVYLLPVLLERTGRDARDYGWILAAVYLSQTAGFLLFAKWTPWRYRFPPLGAWMAAGAAAMVALAFARSLAVGIPAAVVLGLSLGQAYTASVYYSVHSREERGARAGIHEAVIGAADFGIPLLAGQVVVGTGRVPSAFLFAAGVAVACLVVAALSVRRAPAT